MEYKRIFEQGKKLSDYLSKADHTESEQTDMFVELDMYRQMLEQWEKAKNNYHARKLTHDITQLNLPVKDKLTDYKFVTINPADGQEHDFIAKVHKFMGRQLMKGAEYVFEQRGEQDGDFHGLHVHFLCHSYPNLKRDVLSAFKKFCDGAHVCIRGCTGADLEKRRNYMRGIKQGDHKQPKVANDILMRDYYGLNAIYTC